MKYIYNRFEGYTLKDCDEVPKRVTPHQFRHSRAMHLYRNGMPLQLLAEYMGHASVVSTQIYAYADVEMKRIVLEKCQRKAENEYDELPQWQMNEEMIKNYTDSHKSIIPIESGENSSLYREIWFYRNNKNIGITCIIPTSELYKTLDAV